jgi:HSP20 family protein
MRNFQFDSRDFQNFQNVAETVAERLGDFLNEVGKNVSTEQAAHKGKPRLDIAEDGQNVYVYAELPGVRKEDVSVTMNDERLLTIKGEKKRPDTGGKNFIRVERGFGSFHRSVHIEAEIEQERISATFQDGVLHITLPKLVPVQPKEYRVNIQ